MSTRHPVYLVDDDAGMRNSLRFLLLSRGSEVRSFECGEAFLAVAGQLAPGPVLLDVQMAGLDGLDVQKRLTEAGCNFPIIIMTGHGDIAMAVRAMKAGAMDFLTKPFAYADLASVLDRASGQLDKVGAMSEQREEAQRRLEVLTSREYQVLNELARGHPNKTIGYDFGISPRTVEVYRANVMRKLGMPRFADVLRLAFVAGMPLPMAEIELHAPALMSHHTMIG